MSVMNALIAELPHPVSRSSQKAMSLEAQLAFTRAIRSREVLGRTQQSISDDVMRILEKP